MIIDKIKFRNEFYNLQDARLNEVIEKVDDLNLKRNTGNIASIQQVYQCYYPFPTSSGERTDVCPSGTSAYGYNGFCLTPNGFCVVKYAPTSNKINENDISQIIEFNTDGTFRRMVAADVGKGNGMCYYDGYLYIDTGGLETADLAKVRYSDLTIASHVELVGTCPAIDKENAIIYSVEGAIEDKKLYRYFINTGVIDYIPLSEDAPDAYNAAFYKDGIIYVLTYADDFLMFDVTDGKFLGGVSTSGLDTTGIRLYELEDCDVDDDGNIFVLSQQSNLTTTVYDAGGASYSFKSVGFYIGKVYLNGGGSVGFDVGKPNRIHKNGILITSPATEADAKNCTLQTGVGDYPFTCFQAASFLSGDVREINCAGYTKMWFGDIYQPADCPQYVRFYNLSIETDFPLVFKSVRGFFAGGSDIKITNYVVNFIFCDVDSVDLIVTNSVGNYCANILYGKAYLYSHGSSVRYAKANYCILNGYNVIPQGEQVTTDDIRYTSQTASAGSSVTLQIPNVAGTYRRKRICLSNSNVSVIYRVNGNQMIEVGSVSDSAVSPISCTYSQSTTASGYTTLTFVAPFDITDIEIF